MEIEKELMFVLLSRGLSLDEARRILRRYFSDYYSSSTCFHCFGFCGPSFGQPLCTTCHALLYPEDVGFWCALFNRTKCCYKLDSDDSGNEDLGPSKVPVFAGLSDGVNADCPASPSQSARNDGHSEPEDDGEFPQFPSLPNTNRDRLFEQLMALSVPRHHQPLPEGLVDRLPTVVLTSVFRYVDDITLWCCSRVSKRWNEIVKRMTSAAYWQRCFRRRWPLLQPFFTPVCWYGLYGQTIRSSPCLACLQTMQIDEMQNIGAEPVCCVVNTLWGTRRLRSEVRSLLDEPPPGVEALPLNKQGTYWLASLTGPCNSPFEGGKFLVSVQISDCYPLSPPLVRFITRIFHPNISRHGDIGVDMLMSRWSVALTLSKILLSVQSLLTDPNPEACMEPEIGRLFKENRSLYNLTAQLWTWKFAMVEIFPPR